MRLFGPDAGHLIERRAALITAAEVCLAIDDTCLVLAGAVSSVYGCAPELIAVILLHQVHHINFLFLPM